MYDENLRMLNHSPENLEAYLAENPNDHGALIFSALFEERKKWQSAMEKIHNTIAQIQSKKLKIIAQIEDLSALRHYWNKFVSREGSLEDLQSKLQDLEDQEKKLWEKAKILHNKQPEDWRYQLAMIGNNIFSPR